mmetsp:Transcript_67570/g.136092  ORF Transcript_67570/g.136092 Transcript_67570/m.136092 type:complete len:294 (+) Transcript_67570:47-928(+)
MNQLQGKGIWDKPSWANIESSFRVGDRVQALYNCQFHEAVVLNTEPLTIKYCGYEEETRLEHHEVRTPFPLPVDVTEHIDQSTGYPYWVDKSGTSTWERPPVRVAAKAVVSATNFKMDFVGRNTTSKHNNLRVSEVHSRQARLEASHSLSLEDHRRVINAPSAKLNELSAIQIIKSDAAARNQKYAAPSALEPAAPKFRTEKRMPEISTGATVARRLLKGTPLKNLGPTPPINRHKSGSAVDVGRDASRMKLVEERMAKLDREISAAKMKPGAFGINMRGRRVGMQDSCGCGC